MIDYKAANAGESRFLRKLFLALLLAMALVALSLAGCSYSADEKKVRVQAESILENIKVLDGDQIDRLFDKAGFDPEEFGMTSEDFADTFFGDFSYEIEDVATAANGDVWVTGTMHIADSQEIEEALFGSLDASRLGDASSGEDEDSSEESDPSVSLEKADRNFSMAFRQNASGEWELDEATFGAALLGGWDIEEGVFL